MRYAETDGRITLLLQRQLGLISLQQLRELGHGQNLADARLRFGSWCRVGKGVYRLTAAPVTWEQRALGACMVAGPGAALSHRAAAAVLGLGGMRPGVIEVVVPVRFSPELPAHMAVVHRSRHLDQVDVAKVGVLPVTTPARTVIDLAAQLSPGRLCDMVDEVLCSGMISVVRLRRRMDALLSQGRPGARAMRKAMAPWTPGPLPGSVSEMRVLRLILAAHLPPPVRQYSIPGPGARSIRFDLAWPQHRLALEVDGERWHGGPRQLSRDEARDLGAGAAGWEVLRATPAHLGSPPVLADLLDALRIRLGRPPRGDQRRRISLPSGGPGTDPGCKAAARSSTPSTRRGPGREK